MSCRRRRKKIDLLFLGHPPVRSAATLWAHLHGCEGCARYYDRAVLARRAMSGDPSEPCPEELALVGAVLPGPAAAAPARDAPSLLGGLVVAWLAAMVAVVVGLQPESAGVVGVRGGAPELDLTLRAFCLREQSAGLEVVGSSSDVAARLDCRQTDLLEFSYALRDERPAFLYLVGIDGTGRMLTYHPRPPGQQSIQLLPTPSEQPLPPSIRLGVKHQPGTIRITGIVSRSPLSHEEVTALLRNPQAKSDPDTRQVTLTLEVLP